MIFASAVTDAIPADMRVAIATEYLFWATLALALVGGLTLVAAVVAAIYAVMTYRLEASPGVVVALHPMGGKAELPQTTGYRVVRNPISTARWNEPLPPPTMRPLHSSDELSAIDLGAAFVEVRNVGRSAIVEANLNFLIRTKDLGKMNEDGNDIEVLDVYGEGVVHISSIAAGSAVLLPIVGLSTGCVLTVERVTSHRPAYKPGRQKQARLPFVAAAVHIRTAMSHDAVSR